MNRAAIPSLALAVMLAGGLLPMASFAVTVDFEDVGAGLAAESYWDGSDLSGTLVPGGGPWGNDIYVGGFQTGPIDFNNVYTPAYGSWSGWSYSNVTDNTTPGYANQYSAFAGGGAGGSGTYGAAYNSVQGEATVEIPAGYEVASAMLTNTTYAALSMRDGDAFAKKFGGPTGNDPDWFLLSILGIDENDAPVGSVDFYLADYRFADNAQDYIVDQWTGVDLSGLAGSRRLEFALSSSDVGTFGMNTPAYFAMDNIVLTTGTAGLPEPATWGLLATGSLAMFLGLRRHRGR